MNVFGWKFGSMTVSSVFSLGGLSDSSVKFHVNNVDVFPMSYSGGLKNVVKATLAYLLFSSFIVSLFCFSSVIPPFHFFHGSILFCFSSSIPQFCHRLKVDRGYVRTSRLPRGMRIPDMPRSANAVMPCGNPMRDSSTG